MNERLQKIRSLLDELEHEASSRPGPDPDSGFAAMELPLIIQEIVDDLQPLLAPYEAAIYWYMFRHSIAEDGNSLTRVSTRGLQTGVVKSMRLIYEDGKLAQETVRESLAALEALGAIKKQGEPNRDGTLIVYSYPMKSMRVVITETSAERRSQNPFWRPKLTTTTSERIARKSMNVTNTNVGTAASSLPSLRRPSTI